MSVILRRGNVIVAILIGHRRQFCRRSSNEGEVNCPAGWRRGRAFKLVLVVAFNLVLVAGPRQLHPPDVGFAVPTE